MFRLVQVEASVVKLELGFKIGVEVEEVVVVIVHGGGCGAVLTLSSPDLALVVALILVKTITGSIVVVS